jgi:LAS superfamily LD-carboxypeptidase LdcB
MKKKDIIELLQNKEALAYLDLQQCNDVFGTDHQYTKQSRRTWGILVEILDEIKVKPNMELEAAKQAQKMVLDRYKREFA